jgi:hypothetical protein
MVIPIGQLEIYAVTLWASVNFVWTKIFNKINLYVDVVCGWEEFVLCLSVILVQSFCGVGGIAQQFRILF